MFVVPMSLNNMAMAGVRRGSVRLQSQRRGLHSYHYQRCEKGKQAGEPCHASQAVYEVKNGYTNNS